MAPRHRRFGGAAVLAGLAAVALVAVLAVVLLSGGSDPGSRRTAGGGAQAKPTATPARHKKHRSRATATATATAQATSTPAPTATPSATAPPAASGAPDLRRASALQQQGYAAGNAGDYTRDLQLSQQALQACGATRQLDPCGYANYEVGRSLNRLGRPAEAIPYLQRRLSYGSDPTGDAQRELASAQAKAGVSGKGKAKGKG
jgi:tetratricopeptide (TPR) repeat protein